MTFAYAAQVYRNAAIQVDDKKRILLMVYDGLVDLLDRARQGIQEKNPKERGEALSRALAVIGELDCALDRQAGGEIVENLESLYRFATVKLTEANVRNDLNALEAARRVLVILKDAFEQAAQEMDAAQDTGQDRIGSEGVPCSEVVKVYGQDVRKGVSLAI